MHELSIALGIVEAAAEGARRHGAMQVTAVHLRLGPLAGVIKEALLSAYDLACEGSPLEHSRLVVEEMPIVIYCPRCAAARRAVSPQEMSCTECGTPADHVVGGRELEVFALEIVS